MPDDDWALGQNMIDVQNEARNPLNAIPLHFATRKPIIVQTPACDRCSFGVMDAENPHLYGECNCECHK